MAKLEIEVWEPNEDSPQWWASTEYRGTSYTAVGATEAKALIELKAIVEWGLDSER